MGLNETSTSRPSSSTIGLEKAPGHYWDARKGGMQADPATPIESAPQDRYGYTDYAEAIAGCVLNTPAEASLTIGIDGPWGTGKTSLGNLVEEQLVKTFAGYGLRVSKFDAWARDQDARGSDEFYRWFIGEVYESRSVFKQVVAPTPAEVLSPAARRARRISLLFLIGGALGVAVVYGLTFWQDAPEWITGISVALAAVLVMLSAFNLPHMAFSLTSGAVRIVLQSGLHGMGKWNAPANVRSRERLVEQAFRIAEEVLGKSDQKNVLLIDNLDRCRPKSATEIVEAIDQLTQHVPLVIILTADLQLLARQITDEYVARHGLRMSEGDGFGRAFLERIITVPFNMPSRPIDNPFERTSLHTHLDQKPKQKHLQPVGSVIGDLRQLAVGTVPIYPTKVGHVLRRATPAMPSFEGTAPGRFAASRTLLATGLNWAIRGPAYLAARLATSIYPATQRPAEIDETQLSKKGRTAFWFAILVLQVGILAPSLGFAFSMLWMLAGFAYLVLAALFQLVGDLISWPTLPPIAAWMDPVQDNLIGTVLAHAMTLFWWAFLPGLALILIGSVSWARRARRLDRWVFQQQLRKPRDEGYPNPRIDAALQRKMRESLASAKEGFDSLPIEIYPAFGPTFLPTHRSRKRMANRARLISKIAERRPDLRAIQPHLLIAWCVALEADAAGKPDSATWKRLLEIAPQLGQHEATLLRLGFRMPVRPMDPASPLAAIPPLLA